MRDGRREDHRGHGEPRDAHRGAQRDAPVRPHQGLREAGARAPGRAERGQPRGAARRRCGCSPRCSGRSRPHLAEELWIALGGDEHGAQTPWPGVSFRCPHEHPHRTEPPQGSRQRTRSCATGLRLPPLRAQLPARASRCSRARTAARASTSSTTTSWRRATSARCPAPSARRTSGTSRSCCRSSTRCAQARVGQHSGYTPLIRADRLGAELGHRQPLPEGRLHLAAEPLLQGPRGVDVGRAPARARQGRRSAASPPATSARPSPRSRPRRASTPTSSTPTASRTRRRGPASRSARRSARSRATTTKPTAAAANSPKRRAWTSRTSRCARSTPRARRPPRSRSSSSSTGSAPEHIVTAAAGGTLSSRLHKGLSELQLLGLAETDAHAHPHRPAERLQPDRQRDPRRGGRGPCR